MCATFLSTNAKFEPCLVKQNFCRLILTVCTTFAIFLLPVVMKVTKTTTVEREYSKTTKNHQKLITQRIREAPYLAQYTKIGKVIKLFRTVAFTDLDQWQFVLKLSGHLSFIFLDLCTKKEETLTEKCQYMYTLSENKCNQKVTGRLTFDLLTPKSTCSSLFSSSVGIWSKQVFSLKTFIAIALGIIILTFKWVTRNSICVFLSWCSTKPNMFY